MPLTMLQRLAVSTSIAALDGCATIAVEPAAPVVAEASVAVESQ